MRLLLPLVIMLVGCGKAESAKARALTLEDEIKEAIASHPAQVEITEVEALPDGLLVTASVKGKVMKTELFYLIRAEKAEKTSRLVVALSEDDPKRFGIFQATVRERGMSELIVEYFKRKAAKPLTLMVVRQSFIAPYPDDEKLLVWLVRYGVKNEGEEERFFERFVFVDGNKVSDTKDYVELYLQKRFNGHDGTQAKSKWDSFWNKAMIAYCSSN